MLESTQKFSGLNKRKKKLKPKTPTSLSLWKGRQKRFKKVREKQSMKDASVEPKRPMSQERRMIEGEDTRRVQHLTTVPGRCQLSVSHAAKRKWRKGWSESSRSRSYPNSTSSKRRNNFDGAQHKTKHKKRAEVERTAFQINTTRQKTHPINVESAQQDRPRYRSRLRE